MEEKYIEKIIQNEQRSKSNTKRIDELEIEIKENRALTVAVQEIATEMKHLREDQLQMNERLKVIEEKPIKRIENVIGTIIAYIATAVLGFLFAKLNL